MAFRIEQPIGRIDFAIDGRVMAHQPFNIDYSLPERLLTQTVRGYRIGAPQGGRDAFVQWGEDFAPAAAVAELRSLLGSTLEHTIAWTDPDGTAVSIDTIVMAVETELDYAAPGFYRPVRIRFVERAPKRTHGGEGTCNLVLLDTDSSLTGPTSVEDAVWNDNSYFTAITPPDSSGNRWHTYPWDGATIGAPNEQVGTSGDRHCAVSPDGSKIAICAPFSRVVRVYSFAVGVIGSLIATSATWTSLYTDSAIAWSPQDDAIAVSITRAGTGHILTVYPWTGAAFGAPVASANVATTVAIADQSVVFNPAGTFIAMATGTGNNGLSVYSWDGASLGAPVSPGSPVYTGSIGGQGVDFHPDGDFIALGIDDDPFIAVYPWNGVALGSPITPSIVAAGGGAGFFPEWSAGGTWLYLGGNDMDEGMHLYAYGFDGSALSPRCDPDAQPAATLSNCRRSPNNRYLVTVDTLEDYRVYDTGLLTV